MRWILMGVLCGWAAAAGAAEGEVSAPAATNPVAIVSLDDAGQVRWDGVPLGTNEFAAHLRDAGAGGGAIGFSGKLRGPGARVADRRAFEKLVKTGLPLVVIEDGGELRAAATEPAADGPASVTLKTSYVRQALDLYGSLGGRVSALPGPDVVLRFDEDSDRGYLLKRIELGLAGRSVWIVHDIGEGPDSTTSIELKKTW